MNPSNMTMEIPEIRAQILSHLLVSSKDGKTEVSLNDLCNVRLVNRAWYDSATIVLRKLKVPMFQLSLGEENLGESAESEFCEFVNRIDKRHSDAEYIPTYSLKLYPNFFHEKNYAILQNFFELYGSGLLSLKINFPDDGTMRCNFPNFSLLNLLEFSVTCYKYWPMMDYQIPMESDDVQCVPFIKDIFGAASNLERFDIGYSEHGVNLPQEIMTLTPPSTIKSLKYSSTSHTESLCKNLTEENLSKLQKLELHPANFTADMFSKLLHKFRNNLQSLKLVGKMPYGNSNSSPILLRFPVMPQLKELIINSNMVMMEQGAMALEAKFPKLAALELSDQSSSAVLNWMKNGTRFQSVNRVALRLLDLVGCPKGKIDPELIKSVHQTFPNLSHLTVRLFGHQTKTLGAIFAQLTCLEHLTLEVVKSKDRRCIMNAAEWNSAFTGDSNETSIHHLAKLKSLTITENVYDVSMSDPKLNDYPIISDETFELAFFKMQSLRDLNCSSMFTVTEKAAKRWRREKGNIKYMLRW